MATFAKSSFNALTYATFRPTYPSKIFKTVLAFHNASPNPAKNSLLDLGCGHGLISRELSPHFKTVLGSDPSASMINQAISSTPHSTYPNVSFKQAPAEDLWFLNDGELDMVVAGQAAHWFNYSRVWAELGRTVRRGGTVAFWGYKDNIFVENPKATKVLDRFCYGDNKMGPFWEQPGRDILRGRYREIVPPEGEWEDVQRIEYEPSLEGKGKGMGEGECLMHRRLKLGEVEGYVRTFSAYWNWVANHPAEISRAEGGEGDIVDQMFDEMLEVEPEWKAAGEKWRDVEVENEWGSVVLLARRK